jgi:hypothetical protein
MKLATIRNDRLDFQIRRLLLRFASRLVADAQASGRNIGAQIAPDHNLTVYEKVDVQ